MLNHRLIQLPQNTKMLALTLNNNEQNTLDKETITKIIKKLYNDEDATIKSLKILMLHIQSEVLLDYEIIVESKGKTHYCYNFCCCFLDLKDIKKLYKQEGSEHESLKILSEDNYFTHPLFYKDYGFIKTMGTK